MTVFQAVTGFLTLIGVDPGLPPLIFVLEASNASPLLNPAIMIKNWGNHLSTLMVNVTEDFKQGIRKGPLGEDLIIWIRLDSQKPVNMILERVGDG